MPISAVWAAIRAHLPLALALVVTTALLVGALHVPWLAVLQALSTARIEWLAVAAALSSVSLALRARQWQHLARADAAVGWPTMFAIASLGAVAGLALTPVGGFASTLGLLVKRAGLAASTASAIVTIDQLLVGIGKLVVIGCAVLLAPLPPPMLAAVGGFMALVATLFLVVAALALAPEGSTRLPPVLNPVAQFLLRLGQSLTVVRSPRTSAQLLLLAAGRQATAVAGAICVQQACGIPVSLSSAVLVVAAANLVTVVPVVPGSLGIYSASVFATYQFLGVSVGPALAAGLLQHASEIAACLVLGSATAAVGGIHRRSR